VASQLSERHGLPKNSIVEIPLGVDLDLFQPAANPRRMNVFHLGSSDPRDRTLLVLDAWAAAREQIPFLPPLTIGGELGELTEPVRRRAAELKIELELSGRLGDDELAAAFRDAAVVIQPSSDEGFGLQPLEAMASGAPVIVTRTDAVVDVVKDGAVVREPDPEDLAAGVIFALGREASLRRSARQRAERYSWDSTAHAVLTALDAASRPDVGDPSRRILR
jgi:glycosyltransferase involved in cell wall biosynthesis